MSSLKNLSTELGIHEKVQFTGFQSNIKYYLEKADCFVFSSDFEGLGNVLIEALNAGLPIISTDCPYGPREILAPHTDERLLLQDQIELAKYGLLTPAGNMNFLADAMRIMMTDASLRNNYRGLAHERASDFDIKTISKQYFDLF